MLDNIRTYFIHKLTVAYIISYIHATLSFPNGDGCMVREGMLVEEQEGGK